MFGLWIQQPNGYRIHIFVIYILARKDLFKWITIVTVHFKFLQTNLCSTRRTWYNNIPIVLWMDGKQGVCFSACSYTRIVCYRSLEFSSGLYHCLPSTSRRFFSRRFCLADIFWREHLPYVIYLNPISGMCYDP